MKKILIQLLIGLLVAFITQMSYYFQSMVVTFIVVSVLALLIVLIYDNIRKIIDYILLLFFLLLRLFLLYLDNSFLLKYEVSSMFFFIFSLLLGKLCLNYYNKKNKQFYLFALLGLIINVLIIFYIIPEMIYKEHLPTEIINNPLNLIGKDKSGLNRSLKNMKGKVLYIDFGYNKCGACIKQMKETIKLYQVLKNDTNIVFIYANIGLYDKYSEFQSFVNQREIPLECLYLTDTLFSAKMRYWGYPQTIIVDKKGLIRQHYIGYSKDVTIFYQYKVSIFLSKLLQE